MRVNFLRKATEKRFLDKMIGAFIENLAGEKNYFAYIKGRRLGDFQIFN
jgi:hypothetical protein